MSALIIFYYKNNFLLKSFHFIAFMIPYIIILWANFFNYANPFFVNKIFSFDIFRLFWSLFLEFLILPFTVELHINSYLSNLYFSYNFGRISCNNGIIRYIFCYNRTCPYYGIFSYCNSPEYCGASSNPTIFLYVNR